MEKAVVLLSGGLDSATVAAIAKDRGFEVYALTVSYGQRHEVELAAAKRVADSLGLKEHRFASVTLDVFGGSALTADLDVPKDRSGHSMEAGIPITYVPARNTVFLSLALAYAEVVGGSTIFIGVNAVDYSGYPDCRPEFISAFQLLSQVATKAGVEGHPLDVEAPLIQMSKAQIIEAGLALGVDYSQTHSCYDPGANGEACGRCDSCQIRRQGFAALGMQDPALRHLVHG